MNILTLFIGLQIGIAVGGLMFDQFVSRPTLRILNEELKNSYRAIEVLQQKVTQLNLLRK